MIEKAVGVSHGGCLQSNFYEPFRREVYVSPSDGLSKELSNLPKGSVVGIEHHPRMEEKFIVDGMKYGSDRSSLEYWRQIEKLCNKNDLKIVYLEDVETYEKYVKEEALVGDLINGQETLEYEYLSEIPYYRRRGKRTEGKIITAEFHKNLDKFIRDTYKHEIIRDYIHRVEREEQIFKNIAKTNPAVVILGQEHTKTLIRNKTSLCDDLGIEIRDYKFEIFREFDNKFQEYISTDLVDYQDGIVSSPEMESTKRKYLAISKGEIIPNGKPDYVGSWEEEIIPKGLFEIYIKSRNGDNFSGIIEDVLGTAEISGTITDEKISFSKKYIQSESAEEAAQSEILYEAEKKSDRYIGEYSFNGVFFECSGPFFICSNQIYESGLKKDIVSDFQSE